MPEAHAKKRRHHFVPAFLLAGFTAERKREGRLWVHERREPAPPRPQSPNTVAHA